MKIEKTQVNGFEASLRGMRNPLDSWDKSDSSFLIGDVDVAFDTIDNMAEKYATELYGLDAEMYQEALAADFTSVEKLTDWLYWNGSDQHSDDFIDDYGVWSLIGPNDMKLARKLVLAGPEHRKFLRQIQVSVDITAPLFWWKEFSTYKVGTTANSCSTMHTLAKHPITLDAFEIGDFENVGYPYDMQRADLKHPIDPDFIQMCLIPYLESLRTRYNETGDEVYWKELIRWLPESFLQKRTVTLNYETLYNIYHQRNHHRLGEWHFFCDWIRSLPYAAELITSEKSILDVPFFDKEMRNWEPQVWHEDVQYELEHV